MTEIYFEIQLLNLHYRVKGFDAIKALKDWLDENASEGWENEGEVPGPAPLQVGGPTDG